MFAFLGFIFLSYGEFVELINMHACHVTSRASPARGALSLVGGRHNNVGVSLRER